MKEKTLLIMAAGMGSRFGGLKQIEPVGPHGEFIIDYSIYDAIRSGFNKIVFIIKEENYQIFKETIGKRIEDKIKVAYVFQKNDNIPPKYQLPTRTKPWGTAHAIMAAKNEINGNFVVINSDDFYGYDAYRKISEYLDKTEENSNSYALVGYQAINTLTNNGAVKRGICQIENGFVEDIIESSLVKQNSIIEASPLSTNEKFYIENNTLVSMNMLGFTKTIFSYLEEHFLPFLEQNKDNLEKCEYLIPECLANSIKENYAKVKIIETNAVWYGVTYKEDKEELVNDITKMIESKEYPAKLFN